MGQVIDLLPSPSEQGQSGEAATAAAGKCCTHVVPLAGPALRVSILPINPPPASLTTTTTTTTAHPSMGRLLQ